MSGSCSGHHPRPVHKLSGGSSTAQDLLSHPPQPSDYFTSKVNFHLFTDCPSLGGRFALKVKMGPSLMEIGPVPASRSFCFRPHLVPLTPPIDSPYNAFGLQIDTTISWRPTLAVLQRPAGVALPPPSPAPPPPQRTHAYTNLVRTVCISMVDRLTFRLKPPGVDCGCKCGWPV